MGFERFGSVSFTTEAKTAEFITHLEQGQVTATRCRKCQTSYFPPSLDCPKCLLSDMERFEIQGSGKLATYTIVNSGPTGFEDDTPYILAIVEFEGGIKIFGRLSRNIKASDIEVGMALKVIPAKLSGGRVSYEFQRDG